MDLYSQIIAVYPELATTSTYDPFFDGIIQLRDDGDGIGQARSTWLNC